MNKVFVNENGDEMYVTHGQTGECPTCGAPGVYDLAPGHIPEFDNWIGYNYHYHLWECWECWCK